MELFGMVAFAYQKKGTRPASVGQSSIVIAMI